MSSWNCLISKIHIIPTSIIIYKYELAYYIQVSTMTMNKKTQHLMTSLSLLKMSNIVKYNSTDIFFQPNNYQIYVFNNLTFS